MVSGVHTWRLEVVGLRSVAWLGVVIEPEFLDLSKFLGNNQAHAWVYGSSGETAHMVKTDSGLPRFYKGSTIKFTMDLRPENVFNGTLHASVDGEEAFAIFTNLRKELEGRDGGFVPAVSLCAPGRVRLCDCARVLG